MSRACYQAPVEHGRHRSLRRALAEALLAVQLVLFVLGGAFVVRAPAHTAHRAAIAAYAGAGGDGTSISSASEGRLERIARARRDRGERGGGPPPLALVLTQSALTVAPASLDGSQAIAIATVSYRRLPSVVHGPRGPPHA
jgi:hypothetical protein